MALKRDGGTLGDHGFVLGAARHIDYIVLDGWVFVAATHDDGPDWARRNHDLCRHSEEARIIRCRFCGEPATHLDHCHPYEYGHTTCDEHWARRDEE